MTMTLRTTARLLAAGASAAVTAVVFIHVVSIAEPGRTEVMERYAATQTQTQPQKQPQKQPQTQPHPGEHLEKLIVAQRR
jgi:hypothetical protein